MNAGAVDGSSTEPATTALVTYTGGDWNATTDVYTAPVGADMTEAQVGRFAALYHDGDTAPTTNQYLVARITAVNSGTRQITLSTSSRMLVGTEVATGTGNRSLRVGGAWAGMSGSSGFPMNQGNIFNLVNSSSHPTRVNFKNDQTYSITASISVGTNGRRTFQGYTSSYGDGGRATIDGGTSGASYVLLANTAVFVNVLDFICQNNGATGSAQGITSTTSRAVFKNIVVNNVRGTGFECSNAENKLDRCEAYSCNQSNTSASAGFKGAGFYRNCIAHDNTGTNSSGFITSGSAAFMNCIADTNGQYGFYANSGSGVHYLNCDTYNNTSSGFFIGNTGSGAYIENCNMVKNGGYGVDCNSTAIVFLQNCGFGSGTQANTSGDKNAAATVTLFESGSVTYANDVTPWTDPANGDFRISLAAAKGAGDGTYLQTASSYSGTVGYPDIGAAQHQSSSSGGAARLIDGGLVQ